MKVGGAETRKFPLIPQIGGFRSARVERTARVRRELYLKVITKTFSSVGYSGLLLLM